MYDYQDNNCEEDGSPVTGIIVGMVFSAVIWVGLVYAYIYFFD